MRRLIADPEQDQTMAFEVIGALAGRDSERLFERFAAHPDGRALLAERPSLLATLSDRASLRAMPEGSLGRVYAAFMDAGRLDAQELVESARKSEAARRPEILADPDREWFADRLRDMHDLWHVLTGYGTDEAGEAANLAFSYAQTPLRGIALILFGIVISRPPDGHTRLGWWHYLYRAWRRGRRAVWLPAIRYARLLQRPLEIVRQSLRIQPPHDVHPEGMIVASVYGRRVEAVGAP